MSIRLDRLNRAIALLADNWHHLYDVLSVDRAGGLRSIELAETLSTLEKVKQLLPTWMAVERLKSSSTRWISGVKGEMHYHPQGVVGIITSWRSPILSSFGVLANILAAGNRCMMHVPSELPHTMQLLEKLTRQYFDPEELTVIVGDSGVTQVFSQLEFDHLLYFGSGDERKKILTATAQSGVSTTLILSGKSPVIVGKKADLKKVASALVGEKSALAGQGFLSTECVFVRENDLNEWIADMERASQYLFPTMLNNPEYGVLLNQQRYQQVQELLEEVRSRDGEIWELNLQKESFHFQSHRNKMPVTLVINPSDDLRVIREEICGPVMVVKSYQHIDEVIEYLQEQEMPLILSYFGRDVVEQEKVVINTSSNVLRVNGVGQQALSQLPLLQGIEGFRTFSRVRTVQWS